MLPYGDGHKNHSSNQWIESLRLPLAKSVSTTFYHGILEYTLSYLILAYMKCNIYTSINIKSTLDIMVLKYIFCFRLEI